MAELKQNDIVEQWSVLIEGAQDRQKEFYKSIEKRLDELRPPSLSASQEKVYPSLMRRIKGDGKLFMLIKSKYFDGHVVNVCAENYGKQLLISWYLTQRPSEFMQFMGNFPNAVVLIIYPVYLFMKFYDKITKRRVTLENMDLFDTQELNAFAGTIHHSVVYASNQIADSVGFDFSKVDQKPRGFLNIS
jgi:hypothetical protein